jgi:hypothetical protein
MANQGEGEGQCGDSSLRSRMTSERKMTEKSGGNDQDK